jgi:hypothetical protein
VPLPPPGAPVRVVFLGPEATTGAHALHRPAGPLRPTFLDVRPGGDPGAALARAAPHLVVVLAPDVVPADVLAGLDAVKLAVGAPPDPAAYDRVLGEDGWRARPLPVDDRLFAPVRPMRRPPRALFLGESTEHREHLLLFSKHDHDVLHYAHGLAGDKLAEVLASADVGIALNPTEAPDVPPQALLHLAAGHLLLSERITPASGLEAGIDHVEVDSRETLATVLHQLRLRPDAYERVRIRGRLKAEEHRASRVWPRIAADLARDLAVFGS